MKDSGPIFHLSRFEPQNCTQRPGVRREAGDQSDLICTLIIGLIAVVIVTASLASKLSSARGETAPL
jgi:hypothetical protein